MIREYIDVPRKTLNLPKRGSKPKAAFKTGVDSDLAVRTKAGAVLTLAGAAAAALSHISPLSKAFCLIISFLCDYELLKCVGKNSARYIIPTALLCGVLQFAPLPYYEYVLPVFFAAVCVSFSIMMKRIGALKEKPLNIYPVLFTVPFFLRSLSEIRSMRHGLILMLIAVGASLFTDIGAFLIGKSLGKRHIAPEISPNKTAAGCIGGLVSGTSVMLVLTAVVSVNMEIEVHYGILIPCLIALSAAGQFGDLTMSAVKRRAGIKDFGNVIPGHGGFLDRLDSLIFTAPLLYIFVTFTNMIV